MTNVVNKCLEKLAVSSKNKRHVPDLSGNRNTFLGFSLVIIGHKQVYLSFALFQLNTLCAINSKHAGFRVTQMTSSNIIHREDKI